jgi:hypothetical protein
MIYFLQVKLNLYIMNNVGKNWDDDEEEKLIKEINKQININIICEKHQRHSGGIKARIRKILDDPLKSNKINDKTQIILTYFGENEQKLTKEEYIKLLKSIKSKIFDYNSINEIVLENNIDEYQIKKILEKIIEKEEDLKIKKKISKLLNSINESDNKIVINNNINKIELNNNSNDYEKIIIDYLLDFDSVFVIKKVFTNLEIDEIKNILKKYLQSDSPDTEKKNRIKFILKKYKISKEEDFYDKEFDVEKVKKKLQQNGLFNEKNNLQNKINYLENNIETTITKNLQNNSNDNVLKLLYSINNQLLNIKSDIVILNSKIDSMSKLNNLKNKKNNYLEDDLENNLKNNLEDDLENEFNKYI